MISVAVLALLVWNSEAGAVAGLVRLLPVLKPSRSTTIALTVAANCLSITSERNWFCGVGNAEKRTADRDPCSRTFLPEADVPAKILSIEADAIQKCVRPGGPAIGAVVEYRRRRQGERSNRVTVVAGCGYSMFWAFRLEPRLRQCVEAQLNTSINFARARCVSARIHNAGATRSDIEHYLQHGRTETHTVWSCRDADGRRTWRFP